VGNCARQAIIQITEKGATEMSDDFLM
jgi:hypothetical protein